MSSRRIFLKGAGGGFALLGAAGPAGASSLTALPVRPPKPSPKGPREVRTESPPGGAAGPATPAIIGFAVSPTSIAPGESAILTWNTTNGTRVLIDGVAVAPAGSQSIAPAETRTYTLRVEGAIPALVRSVTLTVAAAPPGPAAGGGAQGAQVILWDGISGVSRDFCNFGARLPWENRGGDWTDAALVPQGSSPYTALTWSAPGMASASITPLVQRWYANGNTGAFVRCERNAALVATRSNANPALRPTLGLTLSDGAVLEVACTASGTTNLSSEQPVTGETLAVQETASLVVQFALPNIGNRTVTSATLRVHATKLYGPTTCAIFEVRPPRIFAEGPVARGVADAYIGDVGIEKDPRVYFATSFDEPGWKERHFPIGGLDPNATVIEDLDFDSTALRVAYRKGDHSPCALNHMWSQRQPGIPKTNEAGTLKTYAVAHPTQYDVLNNGDCPDEVYFRYYLKLYADYQCDADSKKLPGIAGRYGYWHWSGSDQGYYQAVDGNGGAPTQGKRIASAAYPGGYYYSGWSMRHAAAAGPSDANPYGARVVPCTYAYHAAMAGAYGEMWRWGNAAAGYVMFEPDRWYCIEQYVKLNTIDGPFDSLGNGVGRSDGILRGYVDGVLVFERKDVVYRHHPAIRIDEIWLNHYHGGTLPAEDTHTFAMANLVVATDYVGPMRRPATPKVNTGAGSAPAWLRGKAVNEWLAIPGSELAKADCSAQAAAGLTDAACRNIGFGDPRGGILAYSGGTLRKAGSEMLLFGGGGAGAWAGNDVRGLRLEDDAPSWRTRLRPAAATLVPPRTAAATPYMLDGTTPNARHSYWQPQFIDATNRFLVFGCTNTWNSDSGSFNNVDAALLDAGTWSVPGSHPSIPVTRGWDGNWACKHPVTEDVFVSGARTVAKWSRQANSWSTVAAVERTDLDRATAAIDPSGSGTLLRIGDFAGANVPVAIDLATGTVTPGSFTGPYASAIAIGPYYGAGLVHDPLLGKFLLFQDDGHLYTIERASSHSWRVDRLDLRGTAPAPFLSSGSAPYVAIWGRMQYVPNLRGVCIVQSAGRPAYFVRTA